MPMEVIWVPKSGDLVQLDVNGDIKEGILSHMTGDFYTTKWVVYLRVTGDFQDISVDRLAYLGQYVENYHRLVLENRQLLQSLFSHLKPDRYFHL